MLISIASYNIHEINRSTGYMSQLHLVGVQLAMVIYELCRVGVSPLSVDLCSVSDYRNILDRIFLVTTMAVSLLC